jgi:hypothetical protein
MPPEEALLQCINTMKTEVYDLVIELVSSSWPSLRRRDKVRNETLSPCITLLSLFGHDAYFQESSLLFFSDDFFSDDSERPKDRIGVSAVVPNEL